MKKRTISKLIAGAAMAAALFIGSAGTAVATVSAAEDAGQATTVETTDDSTSVKANYHNTIKLVSLNGSSKVANSNVEVGQDMVFMFDLRAYGKFYLEKYTIQILDSKGTVCANYSNYFSSSNSITHLKYTVQTDKADVGRYFVRYKASGISGQTTIGFNIVPGKNWEMVKGTNDGVLGWWLVDGNGYIRSDYTGMWKYNGSYYYIKAGKMQSGYTGLCKNSSGVWYYVKNGKMDTSYAGLVKNGGSWFYVKSGKMQSTYTGLVKHSGSWFYVKSGKMQSSYTGLVKYSGSWYYIKAGKWQSGYTGTIKYNGRNYRIVRGKVRF